MINTIQFIIFIVSAITIYSLLNYYFLKKHSNVLTSKSLPFLLLRLTLITIILTPIATVIFSYKNESYIAAITGFTGYSWLAFLFLFLMIHGTVDIVLYIMEKFGYTPSKHMPQKVFAITIVISLTVLTYGFFEAKNIKTEKVIIKTDKLNGELSNVKIALISDVHFSPLISTNKAEKIVKIINDLKPDIIISTGDLLDRAIRKSEDVSRIMSKLNAPLGKYAITGNHEFIADINYSMKFTKDCDLKMIRNDSVSIADSITLVGVDDITAERFGVKLDKTEDEVFNNIDNKKYVILLKHQPRVNKKSMKKFDLQISGHTHSGQIFPFTLLVRIVFKYICGLYEFDNGAKLYVSRGTGTWGPPIRFLASPEISLFEIQQTSETIAK